MERSAKKESSILLIDDDEMSLTSLARGLSLNGFKADSFSDPFKAWEQFAERPYSLVFSDVMMKGMDGFQILAKIKSYKPATKVYLITGFLTEEKMEKAARMGAEKIFSKPVQLSALTDIIEIIKRESERKAENKS